MNALGIGLAVIALNACAACPKPIPEPPPHFVAGLVFLSCGEVLAAELISNTGHVYFMGKDLPDPGLWGIAMLEIQALGTNGIKLELFPNCIRTRSL